MKNIILVLSVMLVTIIGCRTPSARPGGDLKQAQGLSCDPKGLLTDLSPGGLFATKRVLYNQPRVEKDWIHPLMTEKSEPTNLGLFHNFIPKDSESKKIKKMTSALAALTKDVLATKSNAPKVVGETAVFVGANELFNVFKIDVEALLRIKKIKFDVPGKASTILIVTGSTPAFKSVTISGDVSPDKLLFVLPDAGTFRVQGEKFSGTVIAPETAVFMESSFNGSIYAGEISVREPMTRSFYSGCLTSERK
jgi:choice-of-anchor A domain-containing protein